MSSVLSTLVLGAVAENFTGATDLAGLLSAQGTRVALQIVHAAEELEETAKLFLLLRGQPTRYLSAEQVENLRRRFCGS